MVLIDALSDALLVLFLSDWLSAEDVYLLDLACTNHKHRMYFLTVLQDIKSLSNLKGGCLDLVEGHEYVSLTMSPGKLNIVNWIHSRNMRNIQYGQCINISLENSKEVSAMYSYFMQGKTFPFVRRVKLTIPDDAIDLTTGEALSLLTSSMLMDIFPNCVFVVSIENLTMEMADKLMAVQTWLTADNNRLEWIYLATVISRNFQYSYMLSTPLINHARSFVISLSPKVRGLVLVSSEYSPTELQFLSQYCPNLHTIPMKISLVNLISEWQYFERFRMLTNLSISSSPSQNSVSTDVFQQMAKAFSSLRNVKLKLNSMAHDMEGIVSICRNCPLLQQLTVGNWFSLLCTETIDGNNNIRCLHVMLSSFVRDQATLISFTKFLTDFALCVPPFRCMKISCDSSEGFNANGHLVAILSALLVPSSRQSCHISSLTVSGMLSTLSEFKGLLFPHVSRLSLDEFSSAVHQSPPVCCLLSSNFLRCFPSVQSLGIHVSNLDVAQLSAVFTFLPLLNELYLTTFTENVRALVNAELITLLCGKTWGWQEMQIICRSILSACRKNEFTALSGLFEVAFAERRLKVRTRCKLVVDRNSWDFPS